MPKQNTKAVAAMKLLKLDIEGYRSLKNVSWQPGDLNVLIGPNASGKSNLLRVFELLRAAASGGLGDLVRDEGGMEPIVWDGSASAVRVRATTTSFPPYTDATKHTLTYDLRLDRLGASSAYRIGNEVLGNFNLDPPGILLERTPQKGVVFSMEQQRFEAAGDKVPEEEAFLSLAGGPLGANQYVSLFQADMASWQILPYFQTDRAAPIRAPQVTRADTLVDADGQNLVSVLHTLYTGNREFEEEINNAMFAAFGDDFVKLTFPPAADQRVQLRIRWRSLRREQSAADLSDGTLRFLLLLAALANPSPPPLIAIDEPETGLHRSMLPIVAEYARDAAERSQVIFTTHSAEFLDAFGRDPPTTTIVERQDGETVLRIVADDELEYWLKQYSLGELYRSNELEAMK